MKSIKFIVNILLVSCLFSLSVISVSTGESTSPDGLQLTSFNVNRTEGMVGDTVKISFTLTNATDQPITISPQFGVFVSARWNSTSDANNRDFGHTYQGKVLQPGARIVIKASKKLDAAGTWRFWPAYNVNGQWGPFRWNEIVVAVAAKPADTSAGENTLPDDGICPVHAIKMKHVKLRVVYGMPSKREFEEMRVGKSIFPHGRDYVLAGCVVKPEKFRKGFICPECVKARNAWIASQGHLNKNSRASQAALEEFFAIVNSRDIDAAMKSMASSILRTTKERHAWHRQLAAIRSIHILDIQPANVESWSGSRHIFKVTLEAHVKDDPNAPIPFFGWQDNPNVRWITMQLDNRRWIVAGIATGP